MADSAALRARRSRRHKAGDHSLCRPDFCPEAAPDERDEAGAIEAALSGYLASVELPEGDVRLVIVATALALARALDRHPTAAAARELRDSLLLLEDLDPDDRTRADGARMLSDLRRLMDDDD